MSNCVFVPEEAGFEQMHTQPSTPAGLVARFLLLVCYTDNFNVASGSYSRNAMFSFST